MASDPDRFMDDKYLPGDTTIVEISKMRSAPLTLCYSKWLKAQKKGKVPFRFKDVLQEDKRDLSRKRTREGKSGAGKSMNSEADDSEDHSPRRKIQAGTSDEDRPIATLPPSMPSKTNDEPEQPQTASDLSPGKIKGVPGTADRVDDQSPAPERCV